ncbi:MAG: hypothetical protein ACRC5T_03240, partial [Cetobacterium sp.]
TRADYGKIAAATGALLSKQDVPTAIVTADTALQNNFFFFAAPAVPAAVAVGAVVVDKVVGAAMTAYDAYQGYLEEGAAGAAKSLATDGAIGLVAGGTAKILLKGGKHLAKKGLKSAQSAMKPQTVIGKGKVRDVLLKREEKFSGGAYGRLDRKAGIERHHMPANSINGIEKLKGPSIHMESKDHALTSSYGSSNQAKLYREKIKNLIENGKFRDAMAAEILDVRRISGSKYNQAMKQMLKYGKSMNYLNK